MVRKLVASHAAPKQGPMSRMLAKIAAPPDAMAIVRVEPLRQLIDMPLAMAPVPPQYADLKKLPDLLTSIGLKLGVNDNPGVSLTIRANDEEAAKQVEQIVANAIDAAKADALKDIERRAQSGDPIDQAMARYVKRMSERKSASLLPDRKGATFRLATPPGRGNTAILAAALIGISAASAVLPIFCLGPPRRVNQTHEQGNRGESPSPQ